MDVRFEVHAAVVMTSSIFWDITPCSPKNVTGRYGGTCCIHLQGERISRARNQCKALLATCFTLVSCMAYSSTLKLEATGTSEISGVDLQRTIWRYTPEDGTLHQMEHFLLFLSDSQLQVKCPLQQNSSYLQIFLLFISL
jgi:hypothetical protein